MRPDPAVDRLTATAREVYGWPSLRLGQSESMAAVLSGRDTLAVMPTGSGKSAIYQVPALLLDGPTVVVSPLIALQRDQVVALSSRELGGLAVAVNSTLSTAEREQAFEQLQNGMVRFLFLAPEQFARPEVVAAVAKAEPALLVVDEAHCICSWGHDFRPDYLRLGAVARQLGNPTILALTATAAPPVREQIVQRLAMRDALQVVSGFDRPALHLEVEGHRDDDQRREAVVMRAMGEPKPGIIYTATRTSAETYARDLSELGIDAAAYHAGARAAHREQTQARFMAGELDVVVATTAFGMGIDKADVRFVLHAEVADSLDSYYQEIGRAGRDGVAASAVLYYREADLGLRTFFSGSGVDEAALLKAATLLAYAQGPVPLVLLAQEMGISARRVTGLLNLLSDAGGIEVTQDAAVWSALPDCPPARLAQEAAEVAQSHQRMDRSRVSMMRGYAETAGCRRQFLLAYFGEQRDAACGNCDTCEAGTAHEQPSADKSPFPLQAKVEHAEWGDGIVMRYEGDRIVVLFDQVGYRTLSLDTVTSRGLLREL